MTKSEARLVLNVDSSADSEEILEAYEEAVFEQASFFMRRTFIPKLALARIARLKQIELAAKTLGLPMSQKKNIEVEFDFNVSKNHHQVLEIYNKAETRIKLILANTSSSTLAMNSYNTWIQLFQDYAKSFLSYCEPQENTSAKLTEASIFVEFQNASAAEKNELIRKECARLNRLKG